MIAERLGCQACVLFCGLHAAQAQRGADMAHGWPGAILGDVMASVLQLVHLPIGFQVGPLPKTFYRRLPESPPKYVLKFL